MTEIVYSGGTISRSRLVVASYNIHGCVGTDRKYDTTRVARVIREINADVLGLQEIHAHGVGSDLSDEIQLLAAVSEFEVVTGTTFVGPRGDYGIALFSRLPVLAVRRIDLNVPPREPRCALDVDVAVDGGAIRVIRPISAWLHGKGGSRCNALLRRLCVTRGASPWFLGTSMNGSS